MVLRRYHQKTFIIAKKNYLFIRRDELMHDATAALYESLKPTPIEKDTLLTINHLLVQQQNGATSYLQMSAVRKTDGE